MPFPSLRQYSVVEGKDQFPKMYIKRLLEEAFANSLSKVKDPKQLVESLTIVKSISQVKRTKKRSAAKKKKKSG
jgi:hypothetical protein